jgi:hypothetical protein
MENIEFNLKFNTDAVNTILAGLSELPFKVAANVIQAIHAQCQEQMNSKTEEAD